MQTITGLTEMDVKYRDVYNFIVTKYDKEAWFSPGEDKETAYYTPNAIIGFRYKDSHIFIQVVRKQFKIEGESLGDRQYTQIEVMNNKNNGMELLTEIISAFGGIIIAGNYEFKFIEKQDGYEVSDYAKKRMEIERVLSPNMDYLCKVFVASEIIKNKEDIMRVLNNDKTT